MATFNPFQRDPAEDLHFPLPLSTIVVSGPISDPTYGEGEECHTLARCSTCAALVEERDTLTHARHHQEANPCTTN